MIVIVCSAAHHPDSDYRLGDIRVIRNRQQLLCYPTILYHSVSMYDCSCSTHTVLTPTSPHVFPTSHRSASLCFYRVNEPEQGRRVIANSLVVVIIPALPHTDIHIHTGYGWLYICIWLVYWFRTIFHISRNNYYGDHRHKAMSMSWMSEFRITIAT